MPRTDPRSRLCPKSLVDGRQTPTISAYAGTIPTKTPVSAISDGRMILIIKSVSVLPDPMISDLILPLMRVPLRFRSGDLSPSN